MEDRIGPPLQAPPIYRKNFTLPLNIGRRSSGGMKRISLAG